MGIDGEGVIDLTRALVRIPSVFDPTTGRTEEPAARLVASVLRDSGLDVEFDEVAPGRPNVIGVLDGGRPGPTLCLEGHTDVVTEGDPSDWSVDPFGAEVRDGILFGRGSADMKGGLAAAVFAARALAAERPFPGRLVVAALVDEEGMMTGAKHFVARGHARGLDAAICCEPEDGEVCPVSKGALRLHVTFAGAMAHGAMPRQGRNPHPAAARFVRALAELEWAEQQQIGSHPLLGDVHLTPTVVRGGDPAQMNVIPGHVEVWVDVRTVPGVDHAGMVEKVVDLARSAGEPDDVSTGVEVLDDRPAVRTDEADPVVQALAAAHSAVTGAPARIGGVPGATDGTVLTARAGVPTVVYGPGGKWIAHQADEHVAVADIRTAAEVYLETAHRFLRSPAS